MQVVPCGGCSCTVSWLPDPSPGSHGSEQHQVCEQTACFWWGPPYNRSEGFSKVLSTSDDQLQPGNFVKRPLSLLGLELERPGLAGSSVVCSTLMGQAVAPHELNNMCLQMVLDVMLDD